MKLPSLLVALALAASSSVKWIPWSEDLFTRAKSENRLVLLDLEAVWCHWCHVMEKETYGNVGVAKLLGEKFLTVKVDQDSRPDISRRYEDYGWPATIIFDSSGKELAKRSGYIPAKEMMELLTKLVKDPKPEEVTKPPAAAAESPFLTPNQKETLAKQHLRQHDNKLGGWGFEHKFLFGEPEELELRNTWLGSEESRKRAGRALKQALQIIDPEWGGIYQYSVEDWKNPHFEKIAESQYRALRLYALGYVVLDEVKFKGAIEAVAKYLAEFLRDEGGAFYTSQDADLTRGVSSEGYFKLKAAERKKRGIPVVDKNIYARENGWYAQGLAEAYAATGNARYLEQAIQAVTWIERNRALEGGGFRHGEKDAAGPFLGDTLEMARAFLKLYEVTGERAWLEKSKRSAEYVIANFAVASGGFKTSRSDIAPGIPATVDRMENIRLARFANELFHYRGEKKSREAAESSMRFLLSPSRVSQLPTAGILLADQELSSAPVHIVVVGAKSDPQAKKLHLEAIRFPGSYKRVEWYDRAEGPLPNSEIKYPEISKPAAFACSGSRCSLPIFSDTDVRPKVTALYRQ